MNVKSVKILKREKIMDAVERLNEGKVAMIFLGKKKVFGLYSFILEFSNSLLKENVEAIRNANQGKIDIILVDDENHKFILNQILK